MINQSGGEELHETGKKDTLRDAEIREISPSQRGSWSKVNITEHCRISIFSFIIFMQNYMIKFLHSQCSASLVLLVNRN